MYQRNELVDIGKATSVIFGFYHFGDDPDGSAFPGKLEFEDDDCVPPSAGSVNLK